MPDKHDFPGGVGNTQKDPERFASLIEDVEQRLFGTLPDETWVPGPRQGHHDRGRAPRPSGSGANAAGDVEGELAGAARGALTSRFSLGGVRTRMRCRPAR